jgi:long-chain acyl-CoA synthetase
MAVASPLDLFHRAFADTPDAPAVRFFDGTLTYRDLDVLSDAAAVAWATRGIRPGDVVAIHLQNVPQYPVAVLAAWKLGAAVAPLNPMYRAEEVANALRESGARLIVCGAATRASVIDPAVDGLDVIVIQTDEWAMQTRDDPRFARVSDGVEDLLQPSRDGSSKPYHVTAASDLALLCFTSGTTDRPKAALISHGNVVSGAVGMADWSQLPRGAVIYGAPPLCHVSGMVSVFGLTLALGGSLVLTYRFDPAVALDAIREHRPQFMTGPSTIYAALLAQPGAAAGDFESFDVLATGGAALPSAILDRFQGELGQYIHNGYGLTETTSCYISVPIGSTAPIDQDAGVVSVGRDFPGYTTTILDAEGRELPDGEHGEIVVTGPGVIAGYLNRPEETAATFSGGWLHTGDVGTRRDGWLFVLDRTKEMINASGFKVSPREVEEVLYRHPAVREAAVAGVADDYRGETVVAWISLRAGEHVDDAELTAFVRERLAAFKVPRRIHLVAELPKNTNGKIVRRELRERND